jgi:hypothetical protein
MVTLTTISCTAYGIFENGNFGYPDVTLSGCYDNLSGCPIQIPGSGIENWISASNRDVDRDGSDVELEKINKE